MVNLDFLEQSEIFKGLDNDHFEEIQKYCDIKEFRRGDKIFSEGEDAKYLCIVLEGQVDLRFDMPGNSTSDKNTISSVPQGRAFIWSSLVPPHKIRLSSYCNSRTCKIITIDASGLKGICEKDTKFGYIMMCNLAGIVGNRFYKLQDEIVNRRGYETMFNW
ncbi:MAG: cyclic nucleotide-binding domain-containing protein [Desulfamplus sp.]|nr:cyclic nucleotide-binding domain-containing protein [Desulfamplus sp.]MBF0413060.1 cyclic nucleotide-binding domain-containing protein [Desulfamplus sp.]